MLVSGGTKNVSVIGSGEVPERFTGLEARLDIFLNLVNVVFAADVDAAVGEFFQRILDVTESGVRIALKLRFCFVRRLRTRSARGRVTSAAECVSKRSSVLSEGGKTCGPMPNALARSRRSRIDLWSRPMTWAHRFTADGSPSSL
jgi:hypothetical protein